MGSERDTSFDIAKGIVISLMVFDHLLPSFFVSLFHMPFFFMVSGYFFKDKYVETKEEFCKVIKSRFTRLLWPFILINIIFEFLHNFFINIGFYTTNELMTNKKVLVSYYHSFPELFNRLIHTVEPLIAPTWFLFVLFFVTIAFLCISLATKKLQKQELYRAIFVLIILQIGFYFSKIGYKFLFMGTICSSLTPFYLGYLMKKFNIGTKIFNIKSLIFAGLCLAVIDYSITLPIQLGGNLYHNPGFLILTSLLGYILVFSGVNSLIKGKVAEIFTYIGQNTIPILLFHLLAFKPVIYISMLIHHDPFYYLAYLEPFRRTPIEIICALILGITIPLILNHYYQILKQYIKEKLFLKKV